jgi:hypothetical protein
MGLETWVTLAGVVVAALTGVLGFIGGRRIERGKAERHQTRLLHEQAQLRLEIEEARRDEKRKLYRKYLADCGAHENEILMARHAPTKDRARMLDAVAFGGRDHDAQAGFSLNAAPSVRIAQRAYGLAVDNLVKYVSQGSDQNMVEACKGQLGLARESLEDAMRRDLELIQQFVDPGGDHGSSVVEDPRSRNTEIAVLDARYL